MTKDHLDGWPSDYARMATVAQTHALGQITLIYNVLEEQFSRVFKRCLPTKEEFSERLFHNLNSRDRLDLLTAIIENSSRDKEAKAAILHLLLCYDICTENRNIIMHSVGFNSSEDDLLHLSKKASKDPSRDIKFRVPLSDLRMIADDMEEAYRFALRLEFWLITQDDPWPPHRNQLIAEETYQKIEELYALLSTLPQKPRKPRKLTTFPPEANQTSG